MGKESIAREVGRRIRQLRQSRLGVRMTQGELSEKAKISLSFLSMIERGERSPQLDTLAKIAAALGVTLADLFAGREEGPAVESVYRPVLDACRRNELSRREVEKLVALIRTLFG